MVCFGLMNCEKTNVFRQIFNNGHAIRQQCIGLYWILRVEHFYVRIQFIRRHFSFGNFYSSIFFVIRISCQYFRPIQTFCLFNLNWMSCSYYIVNCLAHRICLFQPNSNYYYFYLSIDRQRSLLPCIKRIK